MAHSFIWKLILSLLINQSPVWKETQRLETHEEEKGAGGECLGQIHHLATLSQMITVTFVENIHAQIWPST